LEKLSVLIEKPIGVFPSGKLSGKSCTLSYAPTQEVIHMSTANAPSSLERNKALVIRWFDELWNQGRRETIKKLFAAQGVLHDGASTYNGPEEFTSFYDKLSAEFSKFSIRPIVSLAEGDFACIHWSANCVHTSSGKPVRLTGTSVVRISNGQFVEAWQNWDAAGLAAQLQDESPQTRNPA
jgi:predicted SnoaL-like aldol condensation-catalyzing enzyme